MKKILLMLIVLSLFACKKEENDTNPSTIKITYKVGDRHKYISSGTAFLDDTTSLNQDETYSYSDTFEVFFPKDTIINEKVCLIKVRKSNNANPSTNYIAITDSSINEIGYLYINEPVIYSTPNIIYRNPLKSGVNWETNSFLSLNTLMMKVLSFEAITVGGKSYNCAVIGYTEQDENGRYSKYTEHLNENGTVKIKSELKSIFRTGTNAGYVYSTSNTIRIQ